MDSLKFKFIVKARCDWEEFFCYDILEFHLSTYDIFEAAELIKQQISTNYTVISIEREV